MGMALTEKKMKKKVSCNNHSVISTLKLMDSLRDKIDEYFPIWSQYWNIFDQNKMVEVSLDT